MFSVLLFLVALAESSPSSILDGTSNKLYDLEWQCDSICLGSGGKASFDPENKICKCTVDKNADDVDVLLMQRNAGNMGLQIITCQDYKEMEKREVDANKQNDEETVASDLKKLPKLDLKLNKFKPFARKAEVPKKLIVAPKKKPFEFPKIKKAKFAKADPKPRLRFKEMQDKLTEKIESLTGKLPKMRQRSAFKEALDKRLSDIQKFRKTNIKDLNILGQKPPTASEHKIDNQNHLNKLPTASNHTSKLENPDKLSANAETKKNIDVVNKNRQKSPVPIHFSPNKFGLIVQPPGLYDEDDDDERK